MRPIRASVRVARFPWPLVLRLLSVARAPVVSFLRQADRFYASISHVSRSMFMSLRDTLRQSLKSFFCLPTHTVLHTDSCFGGRLSGVLGA